ncbi:MAG: ABC transporter ATP-binding protein [Burkholderiales bacterium]
MTLLGLVMQIEQGEGERLADSATHKVGVALDRVTHRYGGTVAVDSVSLSIAPGELIALLGPSGCGKTTLLRIIAGLLLQSEGHVAIGEQIVDALPPNERGAGIVFQNYALFPHMSVRKNVGYGLRARGRDRATIDATVDRMLQLVRMESFGERNPRELSGGQQQRVALARTLAVSPQVLLLDEPFGALDKNLRLDMQIEVKRLQRELNITTIMVTHDQEEALSMADRIAVMNEGRVEQFASPEEIYDRPATLFVAGFVGTANLLNGTLGRGGSSGSSADERSGGGSTHHFTLASGDTLRMPPASSTTRDGPVILAVRPEHLRFAASHEDGFPATIQMFLPLGPTIVYELTLSDHTPIKVTTGRSSGATRYRAGESVRLGFVDGAPLTVLPR